jgi:hypothetical protein
LLLDNPAPANQHFSTVLAAELGGS